MREDLLHFVWKYQKLPGPNCKSSKGENIVILNPGMHNHNAGPDFFNAKLQIGGQLWAGNVEMHVKASDWYAHGHETDANYDNVILHVVWEDDVAVFRKDGTEIPTLELKHVIPKSILESHERLFDNAGNKFINCEKDFTSVTDLIYKNWIERLYVGRLEQKSQLIYELLSVSKNDWEKVLFCLLMKNFGLNINGEAFLSIAIHLDFATVRKVRDDQLRLESLLFGSAGLLKNIDGTDGHYLKLRGEFEFLKNKFQLTPATAKPPQFFGLRPNNFPTIRLSQIAGLYRKCPAIFNEVIRAKNVDEVYNIFNSAASTYWDDHYTFGKKSKKRKKKLTKSFVDLLIINTIIPLKFCHAKHMGNENSEELILFISQVKPEKNTIIGQFDEIGSKALNALESQSKIQLYKEYCTKNKCLRCAVGTNLLDRKI